MINREAILLLISEEKEKYATYSQLCTHYKVKQDTIAYARHSSRIETLESLLKDTAKI